MAATDAKLPYWDGYLRLLKEAGIAYDKEVLHSHYGCWDDPSWSNRVPEHYGHAAERMCRRVCDAAEVADGQRVLDVGCGLGTVVASLNERLEGMRLVGLNIDHRQLEIARRGVPARPGNTVDFVTADGCRLPFAAGSFDVVLALECTMHFASRGQFLAEARRVLRPGGRLALCEHFTASSSPKHADRPKQSRIWGSYLEPLSLDEYSRLAGERGLALAAEQDVTREAIPTFPAIRKILLQALRWPDNWGAWGMLVVSELLMRRGILRYKVAAFRAA